MVDTPPPTVSGSLHVGHMFSFTHTDVLVRYQRMRGKNIFYPMGWDDNGLPTERRVQNYFHVRCDPRAPYDPASPSSPRPARTKEPPRQRLARRTSSSSATDVTREDEKAFKAAVAAGSACPWTGAASTRPSTITAGASRSSRSCDLFEKGARLHADAPTMWDIDFQTAVAQAEVEDRTHPGAFHDIEFAVEGGGDAS